RPSHPALPPVGAGSACGTWLCCRTGLCPGIREQSSLLQTNKHDWRHDAMNLQQLRALSVLADEQFNISKAAQSLCVTQSAISKQLSQLEEDLGVMLLQRTSNRILGLTPVGEDVLKSARVALRAATD